MLFALVLYARGSE